MSTKTKISFILTVSLTALSLYTSSQYPTQALFALGVLFWLVVIALLGAIFFAGWYLFEKMRMVRASRIALEKEAHVLTVVNGRQIFVRDTDPNAHWHGLHLEVRAYSNGTPAPPTQTEMKVWQQFNIRQNIDARTVTAPALPRPVAALEDDGSQSERLDLLTVFTQTGRAYGIIGDQQTGKTYQARHIAHHWLMAGAPVVTIGPKWDKGEWDGCVKLGGFFRYEIVGRAIAWVQAEAEKRHANQAMGHKEHPLLVVFFDDWTQIKRNCANAEQLIIDASTMYASVNLILYFIIHSDTREAWGVDRVGASLKDGLIKMMVVPRYNSKGKVDFGLTRGYVRFPSGEERPIDLIKSPVPQPPTMLLTGQDIDIDVEAINNPNSSDDGDQNETPTELEQQEPTEQEQQIIDLYKGGLGITKICTQVLGGKGGKQSKQVKAILAKFGVI